MFPGILSSSRDISSGAHTCCHRNPLPSDVPHIFVGTNSQIQFPGGFQIYSLKMVFKNMSTTGQDRIVICLSTLKLFVRNGIFLKCKVIPAALLLFQGSSVLYSKGLKRVKKDNNG